MPTPTDLPTDLPVIAWEFNEGITLEFAEDVTDEMREGEPYRALTYQDTALATIERLQAENQALRAELRIAREAAESWAGYAIECRKTKHDFAGTLDRLDAALKDHP